MVFTLALFTGLWYWFNAGAVGYTFHYVLKQPVVMALPIGLIMGDVSTALMVGAAIELVYIGLVAAGANLPADEALAGVIAIPIALQTNMSPEMAVTFAIPFGVLGVFLDQLRRTINATFVHMADKYALVNNIKGIWMAALVYPMLIGFLLRFPPVFIANFYGSKVVEQFISAIPEWILHGLSVAGGALPALGFAITIYVIGRKFLIPFFIIGFFLVAYFDIEIMAAAIFGVCIALLAVFMKKETNEGAQQ
ncbi:MULTISPECIES: PTS mannose/fructose/sorbose/N-acetylgalactosamine transporter subunit IIC [Niallia]|jgi:D-glucosaminate PTS system EIIC component|uniref:PTS mannose/fructose/sorbose/N-acetylgalactosamine transporter subunit IIC n=1 Tax=Niallia TaxID=2837506 RepID=UPI00031590F1|nr:PTS sugar transporter subunit IIC [Niallia circulans]AYV72660.1 PTS sorbose transporter subunit IIC [Niallia circulans]NRG28653.1 PTS sugar transporter subunit IIC [Niallia circulans]QJX60435.1 PTS sugar transporter subunit IIC [Niallia circulans]